MRKLHCSLMSSSLLIGPELLAGGPIPRATIQDIICYRDQAEGRNLIFRSFAADGANCFCSPRCNYM
jgi:hypothetical protein